MNTICRRSAIFLLTSLLLIGCGATPAPEQAAPAPEATISPESETDSAGQTDADTSDETSEAVETVDTEDAVEEEVEEGFVPPAVPCIDENGYSALYVKGTQLYDTYGNTVQLKGISTHGINWFDQYINQDLFTELADDWGCQVMRLAMYTAETGGYCSDDGDPEKLEQVLRDGIEYATACGMYVIVDWHVNRDVTPLKYEEQALDFFSRMSAEYADYNNVIYEICNEPNGKTSWDDISSYANKVIPLIRANAPQSLILVGTPHWSQYATIPANAPLEFENIMYVMHFYAATHQDGTRDTLSDAMEKNLPIFVTEYAICYASGNGDLNYESGQKWIDLLDSNNISYTIWNLSNKDESSSLIKPDCEKASGFTDEDLSDQGLWIKDILQRSKAEREK